jgi:F-type H+-transporting ATPase subunit b
MLEFFSLNFILQIVNFGVLVFGLTYLLYKPVRKIVAERKQRIQAEFDAAEKQQQEVNELRHQADGILDEARGQARALLEQARLEGERARQEMVGEAKKEMARQAERNRAELQYAKERVVEEVRHEVVGLVMDVAGKVLGEQMDPITHRRFVEGFLQNLAAREAKGERWMP